MKGVLAADICIRIFKELPKLKRKRVDKLLWSGIILASLFQVEPTHFKAGVDPNLKSPGTKMRFFAETTETTSSVNSWWISECFEICLHIALYPKNCGKMTSFMPPDSIP